MAFDKSKYVHPFRLDVHNTEHTRFLESMGIFVDESPEGVQLTHHPDLDGSRGEGLKYMKEMIDMTKKQQGNAKLGGATLAIPATGNYPETVNQGCCNESDGGCEKGPFADDSYCAISLLL